MKQCFGYIRVSTQKQGEGVSLEAQKDAITAFASRQNLAVTEWFEEKETAAKSGRPVFNQMLKALRRGAASGIIMHKIDRSARNLKDWATVGELSDQGIDVYFATESLDFRSRGGRLTADIQAVIAADYIRNLRDETIKGLRGRLKQGFYPWAAPLGYLDNGGGKPKTPDPMRAPLIKKAFRLYGSGQHSLRSLLAEMQRQGLTGTNSHPISKDGLERILNNPFYCGIIRLKGSGEIYQGIHEPLISVELFEHVQAVKDGRCGKKVTKHNHLYRGLFRCADCDSAMIPERQKGRVYYRCHTIGCQTTTIREDVLEGAIRAHLASHAPTDEAIERIIMAMKEWEAEQDQHDQTGLYEAQLAQIDQRMEKLTDALIDRLIDDKVFNERKQRLVLEKARLEEQLRNSAAERPNPDDIRKFLELTKSLAELYDSAIPGEKRQMVESTTSNRTVSGKNVCLEPSNWLSEVKNATGVAFGAPLPDSYRTFWTRLNSEVNLSSLPIQDALSKL